MPNHVTNRIRLQGNEDDIRRMLDAIRKDGGRYGTVNFQKIIPMPEALSIEAGSRTDRGLKAYRDFIEVYTFDRTAKDALKALNHIPEESENAFLRQRTDVSREDFLLGKVAWNNLRSYGHPHWYDWCVAKWGTKWNAYNDSTIGFLEGKSELNFQTAWSPPHPILERLSELYPGIVLEHEWADEDLGHNCGRRSYENGIRTEEFTPETECEAMEFSLRVWDYDPAELDLAKNSTGTKYLRIEDEEYALISVLDKPALFSNARLTAEDVPEGLYCYQLRESDTTGRFCSLEPKVAVNHGGSIIMNEPVDFGESGCIAVTEDTEPNFLGEDLTLGQYLRGEFEQQFGELKM